MGLSKNQIGFHPGMDSPEKVFMIMAALARWEADRSNQVGIDVIGSSLPPNIKGLNPYESL